MARPTVHDQNTDQAAYWNGPTGRRWVDKQETQDVRLAPISRLLFDRAHLAVGDQVIDIGCGCGATSIRTCTTRRPTWSRARGRHLSSHVVASP